MNQNRSFVMTLLVSALSAAGALAQPAPPQPPQPPQPFQSKYFQLGGPSSFLGVAVAELDTERAKELKLKEEHGVEVKSVEEDSPASKAGVKAGDVVLEFNGQRVEGTEQFVRLVRETPVGRHVKLLISRNGSAQTLTAAIGNKSSSTLDLQSKINDEMAKLKQRYSQMPDMPRATISMQSRVLGVESESLSPQLAEYFGVKDGALVRSVTHGSAAEKAGIKAGDVITKVGDRKVAGPGEVSVAIRSMSAKTFSVTVVRNQKEMTLNVTLDERSGNRSSPVRLDLKTL